MNEHTVEPQLPVGTVLDGKKAKYRITQYISGGQAGETYLAIITDCHFSDTGLKVGIEVIVKYPLIPSKLTATEVNERLALLNYLFTVEDAALGRLAGAGCVAQLLDSGNHSHHHRGRLVYPIFLVQQFIEGQDLTKWAADSHPGLQNVFNGISDAGAFFSMAKKLTLALREIHRRLVIHGDIWPDNILVAPDGEPILIDFGQALFREAVTDPSQISGRNTKYQAPEGVRSVGGDIYSTGGVLFFLATGQDPPEPIEDIDGLKTQISESIKASNPHLYAANCGVCRHHSSMPTL